MSGVAAAEDAVAQALALADRVACVMARLTARLRPPPRLVGGATPLSHLAGWLARDVYVPDLAVLASQGRLARARLGWLGQEDAALLAVGSGRVALDLPTIFAYVGAGRFAIWIQPAQIDRMGNTNISRIGPADQPHPALAGSRGLPDDSVLLPHGLYYLPRQGPRSLVERVDFVSGVGDRRRLPAGSRAPGRPGYLVTDLGVFDFSGPDGGLRLRARMPGVTLQAVREATPFPLDGVEGEVPEVVPPTEAERRALARLDPLGVRAVEFVRDGAAAADLRRRLQAAEEEALAPAARAYLEDLGLNAGEGV